MISLTLSGKSFNCLRVINFINGWRCKIGCIEAGEGRTVGSKHSKRGSLSTSTQSHDGQIRTLAH